MYFNIYMQVYMETCFFMRKFVSDPSGNFNLSNTVKNNVVKGHNTSNCGQAPML